MSQEEEDASLHAELQANAAALREATREIHESEEFKKKVAEISEIVFDGLKPFLVAAAASQGGPAAGAVAGIGLNMISSQIQQRAAKEI